MLRRRSSEEYTEADEDDESVVEELLAAFDRLTSRLLGDMTREAVVEGFCDGIGVVGMGMQPTVDDDEEVVVD